MRDCLSSFSFNDSENNKEVCVLNNNSNNNNKITSEKISFNNTSDKPNIIKANTNKNISNNEIFNNRRTPIANGSAPAIASETPSILDQSIA